MNKKQTIIIFIIVLIVVILGVYFIVKKDNKKGETPNNNINSINNENNVNNENNNVNDTNSVNNANNINDKETPQNQNNNENTEKQPYVFSKGVKEGVSLKQVAISGIKIGDKITQNMKVNSNTDTDTYKYTYNEVNINVDDNDNINYLSFFDSNYEGANSVSKTIEEANITYNNNKLSTISDFKNYIGDGEKQVGEDDDEKSSYSLTYVEGNIELRLYVTSEKIKSIIIRNLA